MEAGLGGWVLDDIPALGAREVGPLDREAPSQGVGEGHRGMNRLVSAGSTGAFLDAAGEGERGKTSLTVVFGIDYRRWTEAGKTSRENFADSGVRNRLG